jgi:hypothetical protein
VAAASAAMPALTAMPSLTAMPAEPAMLAMLTEPAMLAEPFMPMRKAVGLVSAPAVRLGRGQRIHSLRPFFLPSAALFAVVTLRNHLTDPTRCRDLAKSRKVGTSCPPWSIDRARGLLHHQQPGLRRWKGRAMKQIDRIADCDVHVQDLDAMILEGKLRDANRQILQAFNHNEKLANALSNACDQILSLKNEVEKLCAPPFTYGVSLSVNEDGTVNVLSQGRKMKVNLHSSIKSADIKPGQELILNDGLNVVETAGYEIQGEVVVLKELLDEQRA